MVNYDFLWFPCSMLVESSFSWRRRFILCFRVFEFLFWGLNKYSDVFPMFYSNVFFPQSSEFLLKFTRLWLELGLSRVWSARLQPHNDSNFLFPPLCSVNHKRLMQSLSLFCSRLSSSQHYKHVAAPRVRKSNLIKAFIAADADLCLFLWITSTSSLTSPVCWFQALKKQHVNVQVTAEHISNHEKSRLKDHMESWEQIIQHYI